MANVHFKVINNITKFLEWSKQQVTFKHGQVFTDFSGLKTK